MDNSENRFNLETKPMDYGIWEWDMEKDIINYSDNFFESIGLDEGLKNEDVEIIKKEYLRALKNGRKKFIAKKRIILDEENVKYLEYRGRIENKKGEKKYIHGICLDRIETKTLERNLEIKERAISDSLAGIAVADIKGKIIYINQAFLNLWEFKSEEDVIGKDVSEFWSNPQKAKVIAKNLLKNGMNRGELEAVTKKGRAKKLEYYASLIKNYKGKPNYMTSWFIDLTEEKKVQAKYDNIISEAPIGIFQTTLTGEFILANPAFAKIMNCKNVEDLYNHYQILSRDLYVNPKRREELVEKLQNEGEIENFEFRVKDKLGNLKWITITCKKKNIDNKEIIEGFLVDTTRKKRVEERYQDILETAPIGVVLTDLEGEIKNINKMSLEVLGYKTIKELKKDIKNIKDIYVEKEARSSLIAKLKTDGEVMGFQTKFRCKKGKVIWGSISAKLKTDTKGNLKIISAFIKDITKQKKYEEKLNRAILRAEEEAETKDKFLSLIGHDLKNILASSKLLFDYISNKIDEIDKIDLKRMVEIEDRSFKKALDFLNNLLVWGRSQTGDIALNKEKIILNKIINNVVTIYNIKFKNKNIKFKNSVPDDMTMYADKNMLETIIRNLISNSLKFTEKGGKIEVKAKKTNDKVRVLIKDNGIGMDKERAKNIFKLEKSTSTLGTEEEDGTGLGLKIVKEFVNRNAGEIWVESDKGKETTFIFEI